MKNYPVKKQIMLSLENNQLFLTNLILKIHESASKKENSRVKLNHSIYENNQIEQIKNQIKQFNQKMTHFFFAKNQNMTLTFVGIDTNASYKYAVCVRLIYFPNSSTQLMNLWYDISCIHDYFL